MENLVLMEQKLNKYDMSLNKRKPEVMIIRKQLHEVNTKHDIE